MALVAGVIGYPVGHSLSPVLQRAAFETCGLDVQYERWETSPRDLGGRLDSLRVSGALGAQVTVPHKEAVLAHVDEAQGDAAALGAANVVVHADRRLVAHNTDVSGFMRALRSEGGLDPSGRRALLLGAGGAAKAIALGLARGGIERIDVANRTLERGEEVAALGRRAGAMAAALPLTGGALAEAARGVDLIVNATTVGMSGGPRPGESPLDAGAIPPGALVYDIVYSPADTPLLQAATRAGARALGGLPMLVYVGAEAFELWTGRSAPVAAMMGAAENAMKERQCRSSVS